MTEIKSKQRKYKTQPDEFKYESDLMSYEILLVRMDQDHKIALDRLERLYCKRILRQLKKENEKVNAEREKEANTPLNVIKLLLDKIDKTISKEKIAEFLNIDVKAVDALIEKVKNV
jgi:hypothetical protein